MMALWPHTSRLLNDWKKGKGALYGVLLEESRYDWAFEQSPNAQSFSRTAACGCLNCEDHLPKMPIFVTDG